MPAPASDLVITATQVLPGTAADLDHGFAGEAFGFGVPVYKKAADGLIYKAIASSAAAAAAVGISQSAPVAVGQPCSWQKTGTATLGAGAAPVRAKVYAVSRTSGLICLASDLTSADFVTVLGVGNNANGIDLQIKQSGLAIA